MTVTIAVAALLTTLALPSIRNFTTSLTTGTGVKAMISAALSAARGIAAKNQTYTGIRFQSDSTGDQYMIFIEKRLENLVDGFCAVNGTKPIKLPDSIGVMDMLINQDEEVIYKSDITNADDITDTTTFSIVFSPSGKLVIQDVDLRNFDGLYYTNNDSRDTVFNTEYNVEKGIAMFLQDQDDPTDGLEEEQSRRCFAIYNEEEFDNLNSTEEYEKFLAELRESMVYINPYTGTFINR